MASKKKNSLAGILIGPVMVLAAMAGLWKNETRFDYYRAAKKATEIQSLSDAQNEENISFTDSMDQQLTLEGDYIQSFTGYLRVDRSAQIYCWDRDEDDDGVSWSLRWQSGIESNSRNINISQELESDKFQPPQYEVGDLKVQTKRIEFVDSLVSIPPTGPLNDLPISKRLKRDEKYLTLSKGNPSKLGDERVSYRGMPVPKTATYFGKYLDGEGVPFEARKNVGWINKLIQDNGVLHHLVAGDRPTALDSTKRYLSRLKWIVRAAGTFGCFLGFLIFFGTIARFLYYVSVIGWIAEKGAFALAFLLGIPLALITIVCGYLFGHLALLLGLIGMVGILGVFVYRGRKQSREMAQQFHQHLETEHGRKLDFDDLKDMEFAELAHLALSDADASNPETAFLFQWGKKNGWSKDEVQSKLEHVKELRLIPDSDQTTDYHLQQLIKLALADGVLTTREIQTIRIAASKAGYDYETVDQLVDEIQLSIST